MSTFYLLPPRPVLGERFAAYLGSLFPGLDWTQYSAVDLADILGATAARHRDVYIVYREELPAGEPPAQALRDGFGAEPGDEVVEVRAGIRPGELTARRWRLEPAA